MRSTIFISSLLIFIGICFFPIKSYSQLWYVTKGLSTDEVAWGVDVDNVGNVYWAIAEKDVWPFWYYNILLFKIDPNAQQVWQSASYGAANNDIGFKVTVKAPVVYVSGRADSTGSNVSGDGLVLSYNMNSGGLNWEYRYNPIPDYGYEEIDGLEVQPDGIYLSGWTKGLNTDEDFLIQKISLTGQPVWSNSWDYNNLGQFDGANGHMAMDNNFIYAAGHVNLMDGSLACFSRTNGAYQWNVNWNSSSNDEVLGLTMSSDSMLYTVGYYGSSQSGSQTCIKKFSRTGQLHWTSIWGGTGTEDSRSLVTDGDSIVYIVGTTSSYGNGGKDIFVLKYDTAGTLIDSLIWGGAYDEVAKDVAIYADYLYITGETKSYGNGQINGDHKADGLLLKVDGRAMQAPSSTMTEVLSSTKISDEINFLTDYSNSNASIFFDNSGNKKFSVKAFNSIGQEIVIHPEIIRNGNSVTVMVNFSGFPKGLCFLQLNKEEQSKTEKIVIIK